MDSGAPIAASPFTPPSAPLEVATLLKSGDYLKAFLGYFICALITGSLGGAATAGFIGGLWGHAAGGSVLFRLFILAALVAVVLAFHYGMFRFFVKEFIVQKVLRPDDAAPAEVASPLAERDYAKAFFSYFFSATAAGVMAGALIGGLIGAVWGVVTGSAEETAAFGGTILVCSALVAMFIHYFVFRFFVNRFVVARLALES